MDIVNHGNYTCIVTELKSFFAVQILQPTKSERLDGAPKDVLINTYITNKSPISHTFETLGKLDKRQSAELRYTNYSLWHWGIIIYKNLITNESKIYRFMFRYFQDYKHSVVKYSVITNENKPFTDKRK